MLRGCGPESRKALQLGQGEPRRHQCQQPICDQGVRPGQPRTESVVSIHGQTLAPARTTRIPLGDDRHAGGFITEAEPNQPHGRCPGGRSR